MPENRRSAFAYLLLYFSYSKCGYAHLCASEVNSLCAAATARAYVINEMCLNTQSHTSRSRSALDDAGSAAVVVVMRARCLEEVQPAQAQAQALLHCAPAM